MSSPVKRIGRRSRPSSEGLQSIAKPESTEAIPKVDRRVSTVERRGPQPRVNSSKREEALKKVIPVAKMNDDGTIDKTDYRGIIETYRKKVRNRRSAIRAFCMECSNGSMVEVRLCPVTKCSLHPFRMGEDPFNKKTRDRLAAESGEEDENDEDQE